jgi:BASS family bile acid:Na+ symporter
MVAALLRQFASGLAPLTAAAAVAAYLYPQLFLPFGPWFLWFFAATMFALGTVLNPHDFEELGRRPSSVVLGVATQYTVMPLLGFAAGRLTDDPSLALGFVIVGCAPGAMASNVIVYLAGGAAAYSVTLTTFSTLLAPLATPLLVELLGGVFMPVPVGPMMGTILWSVVVPLLAGMLLRRLLGGRAGPISQAAPAVAVLSIVVIIGYAVAANQAILREVGTGVFGLVVAVNLLGYAAGWVLGGVYRFSGPVRLALAIEIGMQNAGLGVALSLQHFDSRTALPGAVFATWCILTAALASSAAQRFRWAARNSQISRLD